MKDFKTLKEVCELLNVTRRIVQGYEKKGLVHTDYKDKYGHLLYDEETVKRIALIRFYQLMNYELKEIALFIDKPSKEIETILKEKLEMLKVELQKRENNIKNIEYVINNFDKSDLTDLLIKTIKEER